MLEEWRCLSCRRIIARGYLAPGSAIEIKCHCNALNRLQIAISTNGYGYMSALSMVAGQPSTGYLTAER